MIRTHARCGATVVYDEVSPGYSCACAVCDEDLFLFETELKETEK